MPLWGAFEREGVGGHVSISKVSDHGWYVNLYIGRSYDLIGFGVRSRQAGSGGGEAELNDSFFLLFLCFFLTRPLRMQEKINLQDWA